MSSPFNARNLINVYHSKIMELCSKIPGKKYLMLHSDVQIILDKICGKDLLTKCGITNIIALADYSISIEIKRIICLLPSNYDAVQSIIKMIKSDKDNNIERTLVLGFVPFLTESCRFLLQKEELPLNKIGIFDLKIGWIPIDDDLLTFNSPHMYSSSFLHRNTSWCYFFGEMIADAIIIGLDRPTYTCQIYSLGETSDWCFRGVYDACNRNSSNFKQSDGRTGSTNVFIFSRDLDYVTPFCLPIIFEGMMHEVMDIDLGQVLFTKELTDEPDRKEYMNSNNAVFQEIRSLPLTHVVPVLTKRNKELAEKRNKVDFMKAPDQLLSFVSSDMPHVLLEGKQLKLCFAAYDYIIKETTIRDRVDDLMSAQASLLLGTEDWEFPRNLIIEFLTCRYESKLFDALRLLCLWTAALDGLPDNVYQEMYRLTCHSAGYPIIYLLQNMRKLKLFAPRKDFIERSDFVSHTGSQLNLNSPVLSSASNAMKQVITSYKSKYYNIKTAFKLSSNKQMSSSMDCVHNSFIFGGHHSPICSSLIEEICRKSSDSSHKDTSHSTSLNDNASTKSKKILLPIEEALKNLNISADDIPINMTVEDEDLILDEDAILKFSTCFKLSDVQELKLTCKNFTLINANDLSQCLNLRELDLSENCLVDFPRNLNLPNLKFLDITGNPFSQKPLFEQFPKLIILNIDPYIRLNMNVETMAYFCQDLKIINYEIFNEAINDRFHHSVTKTAKCLEPIIRSKWESDYSIRCKNVHDNIQRRIMINEMVYQLKDRNLLIDESLNKYKDLLIYKITEEYLKTKCHDTDDELLVGEKSPKKSNEFYNPMADTDIKDEELLMRYVDPYANEMGELQEFADELMGKNLDMTNHIVITTTGSDGQPQQFLMEQPNSFHIGQSLFKHKSVAMTIFNDKLVKGRPTAEFLPGELRNKDYVKGDMASDIYQKTVKGPLGQRGLPKNNMLPQYNANINNNNNFKKRGRPPKVIGETPKVDLVEVPSTINNSKIPSRPKIKRRNGELRSLKDLNKTLGNSDSKFDYDPLHFIRCHAKETEPNDQETKVWRCSFEPDINNPGTTSHIVATCGGEAVCLIDCEVGKVIKRFKRQGEDFMALAWTTLEIENGYRMNILAAGGKSKEIRLFIPEDDNFIDLKGHAEDVSSLVFNSALPQILFSGDAKASIIIWDIGIPSRGQTKLMRYTLLMRLRCPRQDLNPVMNLIFLDHYSYLIAGCDDAIFAWKINEFRTEKREREPDMELKVMEQTKIDVPLDSLSYDGLAQLGKTAIVFRVVEYPSLLVFDFGTTLERRKGLQKMVPIEICGKLDWMKTDDYYININSRNNIGAVLSGDSIGNIWIYDLDPYIEENPEKLSKGFSCSPFKVLEWPDCGGSEEGNAIKHPVINTVDMSSDGNYVTGVTDNNLVCIWKLTSG